VLVAVHGGGEVQVVGVAAAGEGDVQLLAGLVAGAHGVAGVGGDTLCAVHGGGVAELDVRGDVVDGEGDPTAGVGVDDVEAAIVVDGADGPPVTVLDPVGCGRPQLPVVAAGDDEVAFGGGRPVDQGDLAAEVFAVLEELDEPVVASPDVQAGDQVTGGGEHDRVQAGVPVGRPRGVGVVGDGAQVADVDPVPVEVEPDRRGIARAQGEAGRSLSLVPEPDQLGQSDRADGGLDVAQHPASGDGGQLPVVADEADAGAPPEREPGHGGEVTGGGHAGLVDDQQGLLVDLLGPTGQLSGSQAVGELGEGVGVGAALLSEDGGRHRGRCEADDGATRGGPRGGERGHGGGLSGPGGGDRQLHPPPGGGHLADQVSLGGVEG